MALILFGLGAYSASRIRDGYRDGVMPLLVSSRVSPWTFDRAQVPAWFWGAMVVNLAVATGLVLAGILLLAVRGPA